MIRYTLRQLDFLSETARHGGIAQAARQMNVSAAAVSAAIDKLEAVTGLTLFDRFPAQGMRLTRAGAAFNAEAEALLTQAAALGRQAADLAAGRTGAIHIGTHYALAHRIVLPAVLAFRDRHPDVRIEVVEDDYVALVAALDAGEIDALIVFDQGFDPARHSVDVLMELPPLVMLPASHDLAQQASIGLADLAGLSYIAFSRGGPGPSYLQLLQAAGVHPDVPLTSRSRELIQTYVGKGLGFTLVGFPPSHDRTTDGDPVVVRPIRESIGRFRVVVARARHVSRAGLVEAFLALCRSPE